MRRPLHFVVAIALALGLSASGWDICTCCAPSSKKKAQAHSHSCCTGKVPMMRAAQSSCQCRAQQGQAPVVELTSVAPEAAVLPVALVGIGGAVVCGPVTYRVGRVAFSPSPPSTLLRI